MSSALEYPSRNADASSDPTTPTSQHAFHHTNTAQSPRLMEDNSNRDRGPYHLSAFAFVRANQTEVASSTASVVSTMVTFPLDTVKTKLQSYPNAYTGFTHCVTDTLKHEKIQGFFRGSLVPLASITLVRTVSMSVYDRVKQATEPYFRRVYKFDPDENIQHGFRTVSLVPLSYYGFAGGVAGAVSTLISCPLEFTKLTSQLAAKLNADAKASSCAETMARVKKYERKGAFSTLYTIAKHRGITGLYTGFHLHLVRDTIGTAVYFSSYELAKQALSHVFDVSISHSAVVFLAGGLSGVTSWVAINPLDRAKSEYQRQALELPYRKRPPIPAITWFRKIGYRGLAVAVSRSFLTNMIFFGIFENVKKNIGNLPKEYNM